MATPYYQSGGITIYHGDCREILPGLGDVGLVVTDPPYGRRYKSGRAGSLPRSILGDGDTALRDWMFETLAEGCAIASFATLRCVPPRRPRGILVWERNINGMGDLSFPWGNNIEAIWIFGKGWAGRRTTAVLHGKTVVTWNTGRARRLHPHQKPVDLLERLIEKAPPGTVVDPFVGSGSTLIAARNLGRSAIGIELDERYCEVAAKRLEEGLRRAG